VEANLTGLRCLDKIGVAIACWIDNHHFSQACFVKGSHDTVLQKDGGGRFNQELYKRNNRKKQGDWHDAQQHINAC